MKKYHRSRVIVLLAFMMITLCTALSSASPLPKVADAFNGLFFRNSEVFLDNDRDGVISAGDILWGVMKSNEIVAPTDEFGQNGASIWPNGSPAEITGYFATRVIETLQPGETSATSGITNPFPASVIIMGPVAVDPNGILAPGEVLRIFEGNVRNFNDATQGSAIATATDGTLLWSLGVGPNKNGSSPAGYWYSLAPTTIPTTGPIGISYAGLNIMIAPPADSFGLVNDPNEDFSSGAGVPGGRSVDIWFNSEIFRLPVNPGLLVGANQPMHFGSNDPAVYFPLSARPCLEIKKQISVDGGKTWHDADTVGTAPSVPAPHGALYQIIVTNCGTVDLTNVKVSDPTLGITDYPVGDLAAGASKTLTAGDIPALDKPQRCEQPGDFENIAYTQGTDPTGAVVGPVSNPAWLVCSAEPAITIIKKTNGADANNPDGADVPNIVPGGTVTWTYEVTNIGNVSVPMAQVVVTDSQPGVTPVYTSGDNGNNMLDPGETWLYTASGIALDLMLPPPAGVNVQPGVCTHNQTETPRSAYVNLGTVTIPGASASDPSSYCNPLASLGDFVWEDANNNGIQDLGEPGIPNVTVHLMDCNGNVLATTATDANGLYLFNNLLPGNYNVHFVLLAGYVFSPQDQGGDDAKDSDANPATGMTVCTTLVAGENDRTWDAGMVKTVCLGDFVWEDKNNNGIQDAGEAGISNVTVNLLDCNGNLVAATTTDANGYYLFCGLRPSEQYQVEFVKPAGYVFSPQDQGGDDTKDSDANTTTGRTICITIGNTDDLTRDAGLVKTVCLGDFVWEDKNNNGIQEAGEPGIPGVTVNLLDCNGKLVATTTTDANGLYKFCGLRPGEQYQVEFVKPAGYVFSPQDQSGDDTKDSDANTTTGRTICITIGNTDDLTRDAGMFKPTVCLGDFVWNDLDHDGIQDSGEPGIAGVSVKLLDCNGNLVATTTTDANGYYKFCGLIPSAQYKIKFILPSGFVFSPQDQGANDAVDSDADKTTGMTVCITVGNTDDLTWDAGMYKAAGCVYTQGYWKTHTKYGPAGPRDATWDLIMPNAEDSWFFDTGKTWYQAFWINPAGGNAYWILAHQYMAAYLNMLNGADTSAIQVALAHAKDLLDTYDTNMGAITGALRDDFITTAYFLDQYNNGLIGPPHCDDKEPKAKIGDFVWNDANKNGIQDSGEAGIKGVIVKLFDCADNYVAQTTTDTYGKYSFTVLPGDYYVQFILPSGYNFTLRDQGSNDAKDSDADTTTGKTVCTSLLPGEIDLSWDAGVIKPSKATIGDRVWKDLDKDGYQDSTELGIRDVKVSLYTCTGTLMADTWTNTSGNYYFTVMPGSYYVKFTLPLGYAFSPKDKGSDDAKDSDADISTGKTVCVTLTSGQSDLRWDAGMHEVKSVCTYTQGYWKTHSKYGPARYDDAWSKVIDKGEDTMFFGTQKSWYNALWYSPAGNAYWILAHQYEAAYLNGLNGADLTVVNGTMTHAYDLLNKYDGNPYPMSAITGAVKDDFVKTAGELDRYNNGLIGPGHCADEKPLTCE